MLVIKHSKTTWVNSKNPIQERVFSFVNKRKKIVAEQTAFRERPIPLFLILKVSLLVHMLVVGQGLWGCMVGGNGGGVSMVGSHAWQGNMHGMEACVAGDAWQEEWGMHGRGAHGMEACVSREYIIGSIDLGSGGMYGRGVHGGVTCTAGGIHSWHALQKYKLGSRQHASYSGYFML